MQLVRDPAPVLRRFSSPHDVIPRTHLLSNGRYSVMVTAAGSGYSRWGDLAVTRWREDMTRDAGAPSSTCATRSRGEVWSAGYQPTGVEADDYDVAFSEDRAEIVAARRLARHPARGGGLARGRRRGAPGVPDQPRGTRPRDRADLVRRARARPPRRRRRAPRLLEPVRGDRVRPRAGDAARHPQHTLRRGAPALRGARGGRRGGAGGPLQYETDRARFLGRGRDVRTPLSVDGRPLSSTTGPVLDPSSACGAACGSRRRDRPHRLHDLVAPSREDALAFADKYRDPAVFDRVRALAWTQAQVQLHHLGISRRRPTSSSAWPTGCSTPTPPAARRRRARGEPQGRVGLWAHGISGDLPIVLVRIDETKSGTSCASCCARTSTGA